MTLTMEQYNGKLGRTPFPNSPSASSNSVMPLNTPQDFAVFAEFYKSRVPIFLGIPEHYRLISELVAIARGAQPTLRILVRLSMPGNKRLPKILLEEVALLAEDVANVEEYEARRGNMLLVIDDRFRRLSVEDFSNEIRVCIYNESGEGVLRSLITYLEQHGVTEDA